MPHPSHSLTLEQCVNLFDSSDSFDDIFFIFFIKFAFYAEKKCNMFFKSAMLKLLFLRIIFTMLMYLVLAE